jgi:hypothetical protein
MLLLLFPHVSWWMLHETWCSCCGGNLRIRESNNLISFLTYCPVLHLYIFDVVDVLCPCCSGAFDGKLPGASKSERRRRRKQVTRSFLSFFLSFLKKKRNPFLRLACLPSVALMNTLLFLRPPVGSSTEISTTDYWIRLQLVRFTSDGPMFGLLFSLSSWCGPEYYLTFFHGGKCILYREWMHHCTPHWTAPSSHTMT